MDFIQIKNGKNSWKRYLSSFLTILVFIFLGAFPYLAIGDWIVTNDGDPKTYFDFDENVYVGLNPLLEFTLANSQFFFWLVGIFIAIRFIHKRRLKSLITPKSHIDWKRVAWGFGVYFLLLVLALSLDAALNPNDYALNDIDFYDYLVLFALVLLLTPIQTTTEEVLFRGYLMQLFGKKIENIILLSVITGTIFGALHFWNPEMTYSPILVGLDYILAGIVWCYITAKTNSAELSIGAHAANNMLLGWFLTMESSAAGDIPSLFKIINIDPATSLVWSCITLGTFLFLSLRKFKFTKEKAVDS